MRLTDLPAGSWSGSGHLTRCHEAVDAPPHPNGSVKTSHFDLNINWDGLPGDTKGIPRGPSRSRRVAPAGANPAQNHVIDGRQRNRQRQHGRDQSSSRAKIPRHFIAFAPRLLLRSRRRGPGRRARNYSQAADHYLLDVGPGAASVQKRLLRQRVNCCVARAQAGVLLRRLKFALPGWAQAEERRRKDERDQAAQRAAQARAYSGEGHSEEWRFEFSRSYPH